MRSIRLLPRSFPFSKSCTSADAPTTAIQPAAPTPVPGRAAAALAAYLMDVRPRLVRNPHEGALFLTAWRGRRLADVSLAFLLRRHARAAGLARVHLHALRHACATHLLKGGADVRHVQAILGHKKLVTTALYTRVVIDDLRAVVARVHPREKTYDGKEKR